jgi:hypothetical protein
VIGKIENHPISFGLQSISQVYRATSFFLIQPAQTASPSGISAQRTRRPSSHLPPSPSHRQADPVRQPTLTAFLPPPARTGDDVVG